MLRVLIADDHAVVRRGLQQIVTESSPMFEVEEASDSEEVLVKLNQKKCDCLVLDISMPGRSGLDILHELRHLYPNLPVLILSMHPEDQYAVRVLKAGAAGYLVKDSAPDELVAAIRRVVDGGKYVSATLAEKLALGLAGSIDKPAHEVLSDREYSVFLKIGSGMAVGEIADELGLSVKTVSTYRTRILEKMGLKGNAEIIRYVVDNGLA
jgi:two-component system invasion response regulator UvrY